MIKTLTIDGVTIKGGERKSLVMHIAKLFDNTEMTIPIEVIRGTEDGPTLFISAAIHGDEINGVEAIRLLLQRKKLLSTLKGTLIAVPIVNIFGYNRNLRYLPDRRDLNRVFPGSKKGSLASQLAYKFMKEIVEKSDYGIDLHTGSAHRYNLPHVRAYLDNKDIKALAESFGAPVILNANTRDGSLRQAATEKGVKVLLFEGGEALRYNEEIIRAAENGILWTMCTIGMLDSEQVKMRVPKRREVFYATSSHWIRAPHSGSLHARKTIGHKVKENEVIGFISDPLGKEQHEVRARESGIIIGITMLPLVTNGDALFHIAIFEDTEAVAEEVEDYQGELE